MNQKVRNYLIEVSRKKSNPIVTYQKLSDDCKLGFNMQENPYDRKKLGEILGEISIYEHNFGRPLLSALVLRSGDHYEGDGFYKLAEELGFGNWKKLKNEELFEIKQINSCIEFWQDEANYIKYKNG
jgi:hypothetical protein